jgi:hypothetical protein
MGIFQELLLRGTYLRNFFKDNSTLSNLKLRVGYGTTGQQDISAQYDYLRRVTLGTINSQYILEIQFILPPDQKDITRISSGKN